MSLSKQLLLLISVLFLLIFIGNFAVSTHQMRAYLQVEAKIHAQDTATSLGLSLSAHLNNPQDPILKTMIMAIYDMGYYKEIKLVDAEGKTLVALNDSRVFEQVPQWFIDALPMDTATAMSEINSGWAITGIVYVTVNPGYAYLKLYQQIRGAFVYSLSALFASLLLLLIVLRLTLQSLQRMDQLAKTIATGKFIQITPLPWTTEVRNLAKSMNLMSHKMEGVVNNLHQKLESLSQHMLLDELTGLYKKNNLETDIEELFVNHENGYLFIIKINEFSELANRQGNKLTDLLLQQFSLILKDTVLEQHPDAKAYRFYGSEFAMLMAEMQPNEVEPCAEMLKHRLAQLGAQYQQPDIVHIGIASINLQHSVTGILAAANDACEQAKMIGINSYFICPRDVQGKTDEEWRDLVFHIVNRQDYQIAYIGTIKDLDSGQIIMEEACAQAVDQQGQSIPIGVFIAAADKFHKIIEFEKHIICNVGTRIASQNIKHGVIINLSMTSMRNADFRFWLIDYLTQHAVLTQQLVFSITAYAVSKDITLFNRFTHFIHQLGAKVMIKRFEVQFISVETLKSIKPDYIRLARDLTTGISTESSKKALVEAIKELGDLLDIFIFAENVHMKTDFDIVKEIGLGGASD